MNVFTVNILKMVVLFLFLIVIQVSDSMPQGLFSQGFGIPKLVSWNGNERRLDILPSIKVASPIRNSHINVFGKKNTIDIDKNQNQPIKQDNEEFRPDQPDVTIITNQQEKDQHIYKQPQDNEKIKTYQAVPLITKQEATVKQNNNIQGVSLPNGLKQEDQLINKFSDVNNNASEDQDQEVDVTTEYAETTTDGLETTTIGDFELDNRASPELVASLLG